MLTPSIANSIDNYSDLSKSIEQCCQEYKTAGYWLFVIGYWKPFYVCKECLKCSNNQYRITNNCSN